MTFRINFRRLNVLIGCVGRLKLSASANVIALKLALASAVLWLPMNAAVAQTGEPSRAALPGCVWEQRSSAEAGLAAWVQRCDYGSRKIDLFFKENTLAIQYSDGGEPSAVIEVFDLRQGETPAAGVKRVFADLTADQTFVERCVLTPYRETRAPAGVLRFTFVPDAAYQKELDAQADPNDIPEPPCGEWGFAPDGIQYFEAVEAGKSRRLLFVRAGQDTPLFDENTLQLIDKSVIDKNATDKNSAARANADLSKAALSDPECCDYRPGANGISADFLLETCSVTGRTAHGMIPYFDCQSYVLAVVDSYKALQDSLPKKSRLCLPKTLTAAEVLTAMNKRYRYERDGQRRAAGVIIEALQSRFVCAKPR
jgi:Ssp1 endopeptidase immunity protein Rap1a